MRRHAGYPLCVAAVLLALAGCSTEQRSAAPQPPAIRGLSLETVRQVEEADSLEVSGTVRSRTSAQVSARIPGTVSMLSVSEGDRVRAGQLLGMLESREQAAQAVGAVAALDEAQRALDEARARRTLADATFERFTKLYEEQALTRQEFETRQTERELAHQAVARAEARLRQSREQAAAAGAVADYRRLVAPISGIVTARQVSLGATVFPGQPLLVIDDEAAYRLELAIPESQSRSIRVGSRVTMAFDALGTTAEGRISEIVPAGDPASRTVLARVPLRHDAVRSGMFGRGSVVLSTTTPIISLPRTAVFERGSLTGVWVVEKDDLLRMRLVKTGRIRNDRIEILAGLATGERIVATGLAKVVEGGRFIPSSGGTP
ncbi:efflux RND transporter periplasmic adaptor subunit [Trichlorobacter ammonificans]|uniref:Efflux transporter, RND family, MFP subunit n=1 Tax=Trichlorobacter ammonificans TaxID=2916410 RepID=A0ABM9D4F3_9BACT|nr:efflux RND transporter periplasmic adaptor subunit [Trichlorobacter ammonificans]CAH2030135.1 Efflux transporter, RND family, MFP subunit [Trichlorobacter ammonificans]